MQLDIKNISRIHGRVYGFIKKDADDILSERVFLQCLLIRHEEGFCLVEPIQRLTLKKGDEIVYNSRHNRYQSPIYSFEIIERVESDWLFTNEQPKMGRSPQWTYKLLVKYYGESKILIVNADKMPFQDTLLVWVECRETEKFKEAKGLAFDYANEQHKLGCDFQETLSLKIAEMKADYGMEYELITENGIDAYAVSDDVFLLSPDDLKRLIADLGEIDARVGISYDVLTEMRLAIDEYLKHIKIHSENKL